MNTYYHRDKRSTKFSNSFPPLRKPVKVISDVLYDNSSYLIGKNQ